MVINSIEIDKNAIFEDMNTIASDNISVKGRVDVVSGALMIESSSLDIGSLEQVSGTITVNSVEINCEGNVIHKDFFVTANEMNIKGNLNQLCGIATYNVADLRVESDFIQMGSLTNGGKISVEGDAKIDGTLSGGDIEFEQDVNVGNGMDVNSITLNGKMQQRLIGTSANTVDLFLDNKSTSGITIGCPLNVSSKFYNNAQKINGISYIKIGEVNNNVITEIKGDFNVGDWTCTENTVISGDLNVTGTVNVNSGVVLTVEGSINNSSEMNFDGATVIIKESFNNNGDLVLGNSSNMLIDGSLISKSGTVTVDETSALTVAEDIVSMSTIENNGKINLNDARFKSGTVKGTGIYEFSGDVYSEGAVFEKINIVFNSKFRQTISGKTFTANDVTVYNSSKDGLIIETTVDYYGVLNENNSVIKNNDKFVSEEA